MYQLLKRQLFRHRPSTYTAVLLVIICWVLSSCHSTPQQPRWLDQPSLNYPAERFLSAVGEADNRETAAARARANLSQIFQVAISDSAQDFSQAIVSSSNGLQQVDNQQRTARFVNTQAQQVLEGTDIIEYWQSPQGKVFSLAVLEKAPASKRLRQAIQAADRKTADLVDYASNKAPNPVAALRALENARLGQAERDNNNRNLTITAGKGISGRYAGEKIESLIRQALSTLQFSISADDPIVKTELHNAVASLGIQQQAQSGYRLSSLIDTEPLQQKQGWWWLRGSLQLELTNNGETIAKQRWPIKESSIEKGMVSQRLRDSVNKNLSGYLYQMLTTNPEQ